MLALPREDAASLWKEFARTRDPALRERLVLANLHVADHCARRFVRKSVPWDDLQQIARLALVKAVDRFDPDAGWAFSTFASATIIGHLRHYFRDRTWLVTMARPAKDVYVRLPDATARLVQRLGRSPTMRELAAELGVSVELVGEAFACQAVYAPMSIDARGAADSMAPHLAHTDEALELVERRVAVRDAIAALPHLHRRVLYLRYFEDLPQSAIAERLGTNQMRVSRLLRAALGMIQSRAFGSSERAVRHPATTRRAPSRLDGPASFCRNVRAVAPGPDHGIVPILRAERRPVSTLQPSAGGPLSALR